MKGLDPKFYQHQINIATNAESVQQRQYRMSLNYAARLNEEINKLLKIGFIRPVKRATWLSPIVVVPRKNGKLNVVTITDTFPLPFTDNVLDTITGHDMYSFLDGFSGYNQVRMHPEDQEKMGFVTE